MLSSACRIRSMPPIPSFGALGLGELETLSREKAYLAAATGRAAGRSGSADDAGEDPKGKSKQAEPGRPAIWIE